MIMIVEMIHRLNLTSNVITIYLYDYIIGNEHYIIIFKYQLLTGNLIDAYCVH